MRNVTAVPGVALLLSAALLAACDRGDRADADTALTKAVEAIGAATDSAAGRIAGREYSNAELTGFLNGYNDAEIEIGQMAQPKATDAGVKAFAQQIVTDHRALKTAVNTAVQGINVTPAMPADDEDLIEDHQAAMKDLTAKAKGADFDKAFIEHEVAMHKKVLDEIEDSLGRGKNTEIRAVLEKARDGVKAHLTTAEALEKKLKG